MLMGKMGMMDDPASSGGAPPLDLLYFNGTRATFSVQHRLHPSLPFHQLVHPDYSKTTRTTTTRSFLSSCSTPRTALHHPSRNHLHSLVDQVLASQRPQIPSSLLLPLPQSSLTLSAREQAGYPPRATNLVDSQHPLKATSHLPPHHNHNLPFPSSPNLFAPSLVFPTSPLTNARRRRRRRPSSPPRHWISKD